MKTSTRSQSNSRRRSWWLAAVVMGAPVIALLLLHFLLRQPSVERYLIAKVSNLVHSQIGLDLQIDDLELTLIRSCARVEGLRLAQPASSPLVTVDEIETCLRVASLWRRPITLRDLRVRALHLDLDQPLPKLPETSSAEDSELALLVEHLEIVESGVEGPVFPVELDEWIESWWMEDVEIRGRIEESDLSLTLGAKGRWQRRDGKPAEITIDGRLEGALEGPWSVARLVMTGEGLEAEISVDGGFADDLPLNAEFVITVEPHQLVPVPAADGPIRLAGEVDLRGKRGSIDLIAKGLPIELAGPWLDDELAEVEDLRQWRLDLEASMTPDSSETDRWGQASLRLVRHQDVWLEGELEFFGRPGSGELAVRFDTRVLPQQSGERSASGVLALDESDLGPRFTLRDGELAIVSTELKPLIDAVEELSPGRLPEQAGDIAVGVLDARGTVEGPIDALQVDLEAGWRGGGQGAVTLQGSGVPQQRVIDAALEVSRFDVSRLRADIRGEIDADGSITLREDRARWSMALNSAGIDVRDAELGIVDLRIELSGDENEMTLDSLSARVEERQLEARGYLTLPTPIENAELVVSVDDPVAGLERVELTVALKSGAVNGTGSVQSSNGEQSHFNLIVPWLTLAARPELAPTLEGLPVAGRAGPVELDWELPRADWLEVVTPHRELPNLTSLVLGSRGRLVLDPALPLAARGEIVVDTPVVEGEDLSLAALQPIRLRLDRGEWILEQATFETPAGPLEVEGWSRIATNWLPGDAIEDAVERFQLEANGVLPLELLQRSLGEIETRGTMQIAITLSGTPSDLNGELRVLGKDAEVKVGSAEGPTISAPEAVAVFAGDRVRVERLAMRLDGLPISATAEGSLDSLRALLASELPEGAQALEPFHLTWQIDAADWAPTLHRLGVDDSLSALRLGVEGEVRVDPTRPTEAVGWLEVGDLSLMTEGHEIRGETTLRVEASDRRIEVEPFRLSVAGQPFGAQGSLDLATDWKLDQPEASIVESIQATAQGTLAAGLLNPFLAGGAGEGLLEIELELEGTLEEPLGHIRIDGPEASVLFIAPYVAKIEAPEFDIELVDGRAFLRDGRIRLNGGDVELDGSLGLDGLDLSAAFDGLRFRLDHGLLTSLDGDLRLTTDEAFRGRLSGEIIVDRGSLTRPINIDRDLISGLLSPIDTVGTEGSPLEQIDLDLRLETRRSVRMRNNVGDLAVRWNEVSVRGTLAEPVIDGRFEVEPGGRVYLFGQTLRIDRGVMDFPGIPGAAATLDLETTSSLDDPSISRLRGDQDLALEEEPTADDLETRAREVGWTTAAYLSEQVATRISEAVPAARLTFRPILIFGEADPGARLTVGRDFSRYVTLAASIDLRNAERQTYLMDAHDLPALPGLVAQVFTGQDRSSEGLKPLETNGATLQYRHRFGSYRRPSATGPRLRRLEIDRVAGVSRRRLRRAAGISKGDRASTDDLFLTEVEIGEDLRRLGFTDARVTVRSQPVPDRPRRVDVRVAIQAGPRARFHFEGVKVPKSGQRSITSIYRGDFYEPIALEEMGTQAVRVLRSNGFLHPRVEIDVESIESDAGLMEKRVLVRTEGGDRMAVKRLEIEGLPADQAETVQTAFATLLQRVELAAGEPSAEGRLLSAVQSLGYPEPRITARRLSDDGDLLSIDIEPGVRRHVESVQLIGIGDDLIEQVQPVVGVASGDPARRDRIAAGALAIESELETLGYVDARVTPRVEGFEGASDTRVGLVYDIDLGIAHTVGESRIAGLRSTSKRWATSVAEMESGVPLRESEVAAARSRLYDTGLFTMVSSEEFVTEGGRTEIVFDVEERPRFSVAYGVRWDDQEGAQGVVDVVDKNFLGRAMTLGVRGLYRTDDWNLRLGAGWPRAFGTRGAVELFASYQEIFDESSGQFTTTQFDEQIVESSLQYVYPFGPRISGRVYGRYRLDTLKITDIDEDPIFPLPPISQELEFKTPILGTLWTYDSRDRELVLTRGLFASLDLSGTGGFLDSDFEYIRMFGQFNIYLPMARWQGRGLSWAQSYRLGLADSFDQELDRNDRFFAGGQYSVRGYPLESLGPEETLGDQTFPLGGKTLVVINQELRFDLLGPVAGVAFFDLGNVWEETAEFDTELFKSLGVGLRAVTPVGLLRLDWAFPLDRRPSDPSSKIYFGFGNTF